LTHHDETMATDRLRRALLAFQSAQVLLLAAHCRLQGLPAEEIEAFWLAPGGRVKRHVHATATEVVATFQVFSAGGLIAAAADQHLVTQAQQHLAQSVA